MTVQRSGASSLVLNALPVLFDREAHLEVARVVYEGKDPLAKLRSELAGTHVVQRAGRHLELVALASANNAMGCSERVPAAKVPTLVAALVRDWLLNHYHGLGRVVETRGRSLVLIAGRPEDELLRSIAPSWTHADARIELRKAYRLEPRVVGPHEARSVVLALDAITRVRIDVPINELVAKGVAVDGLYACRREPVEDYRAAPFLRLVGRVQKVTSEGIVLLDDHGDGPTSMPASELYLEPRLENLEHVIRCMNGKHPKAQDGELADRLWTLASSLSVGEKRLTRIQSLSRYLQGQSPAQLSASLGCRFGDLLDPAVSFSREIVERPALVFDPSGRNSHQLSLHALDRHGPYDKYQFAPKALNIAVICQARAQGRVETFVDQFLHGLQAGDIQEIGFLRRFALERPMVQTFTVDGTSAGAYKQAALAAAEYSTDRGLAWHLALVQIDERMKDLEPSMDPYVTCKGFFLSKGIAVQHFEFETVEQHDRQRIYSLRNIGLAAYAKLGGTPWLLPTNHRVAHELVVGLGSYQDKTSRFGAGTRYVGITTVFSGDGRYLLEGRTKSVPFESYSSAVLTTLREAVERVRREDAWRPTDPVRLIFHAFKPVKHAEIDAVRALMQELDLAHATYAFVHVADNHPYLLFDRSEQGAPGRRGATKGKLAAPRGLVVKLSDREALVCLKGARELKQASDGHPEPIKLELHGESSFQDLTYLARQAFAFSCHSWRTFLPAPMPITILYSELVAKSLRQLSAFPGWSDDALVGTIGRTRWFL